MPQPTLLFTLKTAFPRLRLGTPIRQAEAACLRGSRSGSARRRSRKTRRALQKREMPQPTLLFTLKTAFPRLRLGTPIRQAEAACLRGSRSGSARRRSRKTRRALQKREMPQPTLLFTLKYPMRFSASSLRLSPTRRSVSSGLPYSADRGEPKGTSSAKKASTAKISSPPGYERRPPGMPWVVLERGGASA